MERRNSLLAQLNSVTKWRVRNVLVVIGIWTALATSYFIFAVMTPIVSTVDVCNASDMFSRSFKPFTYAIAIHGLVCTFIIISFYGAIAKIVYSSSRQVALGASRTEQQRQQLQAALHITKMMALVYGVFNVCYIPIGVSVATISKSPPLWHYILHQLLVCLADVNFWINPAIYAWRNKQFRKAIQQLFSGCLQWCRCHNNSVGPVNASAAHQVYVQTVSVPTKPSTSTVTPGTSKPIPSTSRTLEPRREFMLGPQDLPHYQAHSSLPNIDM